MDGQDRMTYRDLGIQGNYDGLSFWGVCTFCFIRLAGSNVKATSLEVELT